MSFGFRAYATRGTDPATKKLYVFNRKLYENTVKLWKEATMVFVYEIVNSGLVHVDTGMSISSLKPLARLLSSEPSYRKYRLLSVINLYAEANQKHKRRKGYTDLEGNYHSEPDQSAKLGDKLGEDSFRLNYGGANRVIFRFHFDLKVYQYNLNDPASWKSLEAGRNAFMAYLQSNALKVIPRLEEWM
jgi:hypothetical protein